MPAHYPLPTICHLMPCQMSIALRAKTVRDLCAKDEPCGGLNPKVAKSAKCGANGEDRWKKMWILVAQVPRCCPTLVAHCSLAMQYLSQKGEKNNKSQRLRSWPLHISNGGKEPSSMRIHWQTISATQQFQFKVYQLRSILAGLLDFLSGGTFRSFSAFATINISVNFICSFV